MKYKVKRFSRKTIGVDEKRSQIYKHNQKVSKEMSREIEEYEKKNPIREEDVRRSKEWEDDINNEVKHGKTTHKDRVKGVKSALSNLKLSAKGAILDNSTESRSPGGKIYKRGIKDRLKELKSGISSMPSYYKAEIEARKYRRAVDKYGDSPKLSEYEKNREEEMKKIAEKYYKQMKSYD